MKKVLLVLMLVIIPSFALAHHTQVEVYTFNSIEELYNDMNVLQDKIHNDTLFMPTITYHPNSRYTNSRYERGVKVEHYIIHDHNNYFEDDIMMYNYYRSQRNNNRHDDYEYRDEFGYRRFYSDDHRGYSRYDSKYHRDYDYRDDDYDYEKRSNRRNRNSH
jgi:hypothetical protein